ncbi:MAG: tripartite tricarboxylate transporter TctB family protein [Albidovulum sp.]|nr:tripartite tricarboxylate transporter TctB family protein [Albidovulum sp.]
MPTNDSPGPERPGKFLARRSDRIFGAIMIAIALFYIWSASQTQVSFLSDPVGSKTFPYIVGAVSILCALIFILRPDPDPTWPRLATAAKIAFAVVVLIGFAVSLEPLGFIIPAAVASSLISYQISPKPFNAMAAGVGLSVVLFAIFRYALGLGLAPFGRALVG